MDVAVILINWNGWRDTLRCLQSLERSQLTSWHAIIVDNASTDDSLDHLHNLGERVEVIASPKNLGWTGGCNLGIKRAIELDSEYVFLLNNDALVDENTLSILISEASKLGDRAAVSCVVRFSPSGDYQFFGSSTISRSGQPFWYSDKHNKSALNNKLIPTDFLFGAGMLVPTKVFQHVGLFDDRFFLYVDETEWSVRAREKGISLFVVRDAVIHHLGSASTGGNGSPLQTYFMIRNSLLFSRLHGTFSQQIVLFLMTVRDTARSCLKKGVDDNSRRAARLLGMFDFIRCKFGDCPDVIRRLQAKQSSR
ncbi:glycosyltransferase family 2 protein [Beijerinckia indica]|uniref:Glycosyl transferase family 2 n=1 Tax=Beijerinckia indica subsp. indica (strain ATCC 9039 / DSM 1715 / NCIMB 8712) TaxID=395963 RepID=B2IBG9_BEII9|nr:glycosyltransferase family 2 protein [Beijerinckia indica]ACB96595.1 glycosyl transferase family 2 [Beijerinckia indica subsp. indica ATCC 9039]